MVERVCGMRALDLYRTAGAREHCSVPCGIVNGGNQRTELVRKVMIYTVPQVMKERACASCARTVNTVYETNDEVYGPCSAMRLFTIVWVDD
jgi:hypothetical protein